MNTNLKTKSLCALVLLAGIFVASPLRAADEMTRLDARAGSKMRMEGTSTLHDWQVESPIITGYIEVGPNFPMAAGQAASPGKVQARGEATIMVRSLRSVESDGKYYSDAMDNKMWEMMKLPQNPKILYKLSELTLKEAPKAKEDPYVFDSKGELTVAGKTNPISMVIKVYPLGDVKGEPRFKISGTTPLKMTDYGMTPNSIIVSKTGDDVTIKFDWMLGKKAAAAAAKP
jgi:hypothetical protein